MKKDWGLRDSGGDLPDGGAGGLSRGKQLEQKQDTLRKENLKGKRVDPGGPK